MPYDTLHKESRSRGKKHKQQQVKDPMKPVKTTKKHTHTNSTYRLSEKETQRGLVEFWELYQGSNK